MAKTTASTSGTDLVLLTLQAAASRAYAKYRAAYDNDLYLAAIGLHDSERGVRLSDAGLALCGSPWVSVDLKAEWSDAEAEFLARFY